MSEQFRREERYIVIKRKYLSEAVESKLRESLLDLNIETLECVVVEDDWPEYETVWRMIQDRWEGLTLARPVGAVVPVDMLLFCPECKTQHIDAPSPCDMGMGCTEYGACYAAAHGEPDRCTAWTNPPHRSHLCHKCGCVWRPADVPTNGVAAIATRGKADTWDAARPAADRVAVPSDDEMREAFETWFQGDDKDVGIERHESGCYISMSAHFSWAAWQAAVRTLLARKGGGS